MVVVVEHKNLAIVECSFDRIVDSFQCFSIASKVSTPVEYSATMIELGPVVVVLLLDSTRMYRLAVSLAHDG